MTPDQDPFFWLLLHRLPGLSDGRLRRLAQMNADSGPEQWLSWPRGRFAALGFGEPTQQAVADWQRRGSSCAAAKAAQRDLAALAGLGAQLLHLRHPAYPALLLEIPDPPPCLYVLGDIDLLAQPQLAIVGSRTPTRQGLADAEAFAGDLARAGFIVTSGLAYGIDAAAHRSALAAPGKSVAVLGSGLDVVYPAAHRALARDVSENGALVSELPLGAPPRAAHFPRRNRVISGLCLGVLVVEAALQSGSLVTARLALEQNREVFALPGSIHNPSSRGCNVLIRGGAKLVLDVQDMLEELRGWCGPAVEPAPRRETAPVDLSAEEALVLGAVGYELTPLDLIASALDQALPDLLAALGELELKGLVENCAGAWRRHVS